MFTAGGLKSSEVTIEKLRHACATHEIPDVLLELLPSDMQTTLNSDILKRCAIKRKRLSNLYQK